MILFKYNKNREYQNFYIENLFTCIFIILNALAYNIDIPDIVHSIIYGYYSNKSLNIILQWFGRAV